MAKTETHDPGTSETSGIREPVQKPSKRPSLTDFGDVMSAEEVAALVGVSTDTVLRWHAEGEIPGRRVGRKALFLKARIVAWLEGE
jgi:excisionase family DNA binding protein